MPSGKKGRTHGSRSTYRSGCRCGACRHAEATYQLARYYRNLSEERKRRAQVMKISRTRRGLAA